MNQKIYSKKIFFCANNFFVLYNFRYNIIKKFVNEGFQVSLVAEADGYENKFRDIIGKGNIYSFKKRNLVIDLFSFISLNTRLFLINKDCIFYTFTAKSNLLYGFLNYIKRKTLIANVTGLGIIWDYKFLNFFFKFVLFLALQKSKIIFVQNDRDFNLFKAIMKKSRVEIIKINGSGVNLNIFENKNNKRKFKKITFAMVSRLKNRKGYKNYLEACKLFNKTNIQNCSFKFLTGYGTNPKVLNKLKAKYRNVDISGFTSDIKGFLTTIDCLIYPSIYNEGTPKILLEALASGCAIVTTNKPGCLETIKNGVNGYLLENNNPETIAKAMKLYLNLNNKQKEVFSNESILLAKNKFDEKYVIEKYLNSL